MPSEHCDAVIVGCGIAGAALAWQLHWAGLKLTVFDKPDPHSASRVAAGLISPLSGKRHTPTYEWDHHWPAAQAFYRRVERESEQRLLSVIPQLRLVIPNPDERLSPDLAGNLSPLNPKAPYYAALSETARRAKAISIESGLVDVKHFLEVTITMLKQHHQYYAEALAYPDIVMSEHMVSLEKLEITADHLVFSEGWAAASNPFFPDLEYQPARGEALHFTTKDLPAELILHRDVSITPQGSDRFIIGATYDREQLSSGPTAAGRRYLLDQLNSLLNIEFEIGTHTSAVRPIINGRLPVLRQHALHPHCWLFNGLASRGCLQAPSFADTLKRAIVDGEHKQPAPPSGVRSQTNHCWSNRYSHRDRLTTVAHRLIRDHLHSGDTAIDATAGNGNDTKCLSEIVGPNGQVYAFDIQALAIDRAKKRLGETTNNVSLINDSHARMAKYLAPRLHGKIAVVTFNLGYLPGGDETVTTQAHSSCEAIASAVDFLKPGGICLILCYPGHPGGAEEMQEVVALLTELKQNGYCIDCHEGEAQASSGPVLFQVKKKPQ